MQSALDLGVQRAEQFGGRAEAAVWALRWPAPLTSGSAAPMRMWSMSKPVAAIALLRIAEKSHHPLSAVVQDAMRRAIQRSENCRQRRVVLELQKLAGGVTQARAAVESVLREAGSAAIVASEAAPAETSCRDYLTRSGAGLAEPLGPALLLGTSTWSVSDAVAFAHALSAGRYGEAGASVLRLMREPKLSSDEQLAGGYTASLDWGAGRALANWDPAYKAGWGGSLHGNFLAGQIAVVEIHGVPIAIAAMFHPTTEPAGDDPGLTSAPRAVEEILATVTSALARAHPE
jgi:hypothetical protein